MTPAARYAAASGVLDRIAQGVPAEKALLGWSRNARYAGSKDRAAVRDICFDVLRAWNSCAATGGLVDGAAEPGRALILGLLRLQGLDPNEVFTGARHALPVLTYAEAKTTDQSVHPVPDVPGWILPNLTNSLEDDLDDYLDHLRRRAPIFIRANTRRAVAADVLTSLSKDGIATRPHPDIRTCLEVVENANKITRSKAYQEGLIELQDASSQDAVLRLPVKDGDRVLDFCAGGGGKALAIAARGQVTVDAHDIAFDRMKDLPERSGRAGVTIRRIRDPKGPYDLVFCDAPCSGSGTWRRAPEGKWKLTPDRLTELTQIQLDILTKAALLVNVTGHLAYATCSVLREENEQVVQAFLAGHENWRQTFEKRTAMGPNGDGFFVVVFARK